MAGEHGIPALAVGHHHSHIAAICAEHGVKEPVIGLAIDGVGLGADGGAWGGELLRVDGAQCQRIGHLTELNLPGGDRAAREPWRMAVSVLQGMGLGHRIAGWQQKHYPGREAGPLLTMLARKLRCPPTTSMGRLFDAAAGLLGLRAESHFEGQAAMELESLAARHGQVAPMAGGMVLQASGPDFSPLLAALLDCDDAAYGAALFHATLAAGLSEWINVAVDREKLTKIAIGGGCAMNRILMSALAETLGGTGVTLLEAQQVPANDGGLSLGQAWVARCAWKDGFFENVADHAA